MADDRNMEQLCATGFAAVLRDIADTIEKRQTGEGLDFGDVFKSLIADRGATPSPWYARTDWPEGDRISVAWMLSKTTPSYLRIVHADGTAFPWTPSQEDLMTEDWFEVRGR